MERWVEADHVYVGNGFVLCPECAAQAEPGTVEAYPVEVYPEVESPDVCDNCHRVLIGPTITSAAGCASPAVLEGLMEVHQACEVEPEEAIEELQSGEYVVDPLSSTFRLMTEVPDSTPDAAWTIYGGEYLVLKYDGAFVALRRRW